VLGFGSGVGLGLAGAGGLSLGGGACVACCGECLVSLELGALCGRAGGGGDGGRLGAAAGGLGVGELRADAGGVERRQPSRSPAGAVVPGLPTV
jgi:hypothetical protein